MFALFYGRVVVHALEEKPFRRQRRPGFFAVTAGEDARHGLRRKTPRTGLTEGAYVQRPGLAARYAQS